MEVQRTWLDLISLLSSPNDTFWKDLNLLVGQGSGVGVDMV